MNPRVVVKNRKRVKTINLNLNFIVLVHQSYGLTDKMNNIGCTVLVHFQISVRFSENIRGSGRLGSVISDVLCHTNSLQTAVCFNSLNASTQRL